MKKLYLCLMLLVSITFSGCADGTLYQRSIFDDETKIIKESDSYSFKKRVIENKDNELKIKYKKFYGMDTLYEFKSEGEGLVTIEYDSRLEKGKFRIVLIDSDEVIDILKEHKGSYSFKFKDKKIILKIIGYNASGELDLKLNINKNAEILYEIE